MCILANTGCRILWKKKGVALVEEALFWQQFFQETPHFHFLYKSLIKQLMVFHMIDTPPRKSRLPATQHFLHLLVHTVCPGWVQVKCNIKHWFIPRAKTISHETRSFQQGQNDQVLKVFAITKTKFALILQADCHLQYLSSASYQLKQTDEGRLLPANMIWQIRRASMSLCGSQTPADAETDRWDSHTVGCIQHTTLKGKMRAGRARMTLSIFCRLQNRRAPVWASRCFVTFDFKAVIQLVRWRTTHLLLTTHNV